MRVWAYEEQQDKVNELCPTLGNHIVVAVPVGASTKFQNLSGTSASTLQQQPVVPYQEPESLDRKAVVFHMPRASAAVRRIAEGTAGLVLSAYC